MTGSITTFHRHPERGSQDRALIEAVFDATVVGHVGFLRDGKPSVIPTLVVRHGAEVLIHGSPASAPLRAAKAGADLCVTVTVLDGLVLARSAFNHSANYRSVVIYGNGRWLGGEEKAAALDRITERLVPGRVGHLRQMTRNEIAGTAVIAVSLEHATVKVRSGPPQDEDDDYELDIWAGVIPVETTLGSPVADPANPPGLDVPEHVKAMKW